jgi:hypothetical protein
MIRPSLDQRSGNRPRRRRQKSRQPAPDGRVRNRFAMVKLESEPRARTRRSFPEHVP